MEPIVESINLTNSLVRLTKDLDRHIEECPVCANNPHKCPVRYYLLDMANKFIILINEKLLEIKVYIEHAKGTELSDETIKDTH